MIQYKFILPILLNKFAFFFGLFSNMKFKIIDTYIVKLLTVLRNPRKSKHFKVASYMTNWQTRCS